MARLWTGDTLVSVLDSAGFFGTMEPESVRTNVGDWFRVEADPWTPREHVARFKLFLTGPGYDDSLDLRITVGELTAVDPTPDGPREPPLYWAYEDLDTAYSQAPVYEWLDITGVGTRLTLSDDQTVQVNLPAEFGGFRLYNRDYTQISICGNGWVGPGHTTSRDYTNHEIPNPSDPTMLAVAWDDLYPPYSNGVWHHYDTDNHRFIVSYESMPTYANRTTFDWFQVVFYDSTLRAPDGNSQFVYQYKTTNELGSSTIGINDSIDNVGIQMYHNATPHRTVHPLEPTRAITFTTDVIQGVAERGASPAWDLGLRTFPNPGVGRLNLSFRLAQTGPVRVQVFDASGRVVRDLSPGSKPMAAGRYSLRWDGRDDIGREVGQGVYLVRLNADGLTAKRKLVLLD